MNILDTLLIHSRNQPEHLAIDGKVKVTYREFEGHVLKIANAIPLASRTLIALPQGHHAYASMFASLYRGGLYCCLNLNSPRDKVEQILSIFKPETVICDQATSSAYPGMFKNFVDPSSLSPAFQNPERQYGKTAYVLFTSGSTGRPKGVIIGTEGLEHYVEWAINHYNADAKDRWSQHPNIGFDLSVLDIYGALCSGATLVPITEKLHRLMPTAAIKDLKITIWNSVPSVVDLMIQSKRLDSSHLASLKTATFCGEPLKKHHLEALFQAKPDLVAFNTYGPTEATVSCTSLKLDSMNFARHCEASVAIGKPIPGMEIHLIGGKSESEGEIGISGPQLADGYLNDPTRTQEVFRTEILDGRTLRVYLTGDWAYRKGDDLFCAGRIDSQIKINGYRIELGEIESALLSCDLLEASAIFHDGKIHVCLVSNSKLAKRPLLDKLRSKLESYSIPEVFWQAKALPRNSNDKTDRKALVELIENGTLNVIE